VLLASVPLELEVELDVELESALPLVAELKSVPLALPRLLVSI
jgi:hypothetical protein